VFTALTLNRLDEAEAALRDAQVHNPDSDFQIGNLYLLAFLRNDSAGMQKQLDRVAGKDVEEYLLRLQSDTEAYHGRLRSARDFTRRAAGAAIGDKESGAESAAESGVWGALQPIFFRLERR
jgi:hypothetical protein